MMQRTSRSRAAIHRLKEPCLPEKTLDYRAGVLAHDMVARCGTGEGIGLAFALDVTNEPAQNEGSVFIRTRPGFAIETPVIGLLDEHEGFQHGKGLPGKWHVIFEDPLNHSGLFRRRDQDGSPSLRRKPEDINPRRDVLITVANPGNPVPHLLCPDLARQVLERRDTGNLKRIPKGKIPIPCGDRPLNAVPLVEPLVRSTDDASFKPYERVDYLESGARRKRCVGNLGPVRLSMAGRTVNHHQGAVEPAKDFFMQGFRELSGATRGQQRRHQHHAQKDYAQRLFHLSLAELGGLSGRVNDPLEWICATHFHL